MIQALRLSLQQGRSKFLSARRRNYLVPRIAVRSDERCVESVCGCLKRVPNWCWLLLILTLAFSLRLRNFTGVVGQDDLNYSWHAYTLSQGLYEPVASPFANRLGLLIPTAIAYRLMGVSEASLVIYPLVSSLAGVALAFCLGKRFLNGDRTGLIAALFLAIFPLDVAYATMLWPDLPTGTLVALSIYLLLQGNVDSRPVPRAMYHGLCGIVIGLAYLTKESAIYPLLAMGVGVLVSTRVRNGKKEVGTLWSYTLVCLGFLVIVALEAGYYYTQRGDPFLRIHGVETVHNLSNNSWHRFAGNTSALVKRLLLDFAGMLLFSRRALGFSYWIAPFGLMLILRNEVRRAWWLIAWWGITLVLFNFGTTSLRSYFPLLPDVRQTILLAIPTVLLIAYLLDYLISMFIEGKRLPLSLRLMAFLVVLFLISSSAYYGLHASRRGRSANERALVRYFGTADRRAMIVADGVTIWVLDFLLAYRESPRLRRFEQVADVSSLHDSYVVVNGPRMDYMTRSWGTRFPSILEDPPRNWEMVYQTDDSSATVYFAH